MRERLTRVSAWWHAHVRGRLIHQDGFQTAEAIGIAAVGLLVLVVIYAALSALGFDVIEWMRDQFGVGDDVAITPPGG
jgi:hypothetical protein